MYEVYFWLTFCQVSNSLIHNPSSKWYNGCKLYLIQQSIGWVLVVGRNPNECSYSRALELLLLVPRHRGKSLHHTQLNTEGNCGCDGFFLISRRSGVCRDVWSNDTTTINAYAQPLFSNVFVSTMSIISNLIYVHPLHQSTHNHFCVPSLPHNRKVQMDPLKKYVAHFD